MNKPMKVICFFIAWMSLVQYGFCQQPDTLALEVSWQPLENNYLGKEQALSILQIKNKSALTLKGDWGIYFNFIRIITGKEKEKNIKVTHRNGDLFTLQPQGKQRTLKPGDSIRYEMLSASWLVNANDAPQGFYIKFADGRTQPLPAVKILPPADDRKFFRVGGDVEMSPQRLFAKNSSIPFNTDSVFPTVFPSPSQYQVAEGAYQFQHTSILFDPIFAAEAQLLDTLFQTLLGQRFPLFSGVKEVPKHAVVFYKQDDLADEAYRLEVKPDQINIYAAGNSGAFYAVQSLRSMLYAQKINGLPKSLPAVSIADVPRFGRRALMLDVARNFQSKQQIKKVLDVMALYKLNTLHFHLNDDEGWRLEIPALPELTEVGGRRGDLANDQSAHLPPSYGSGPIVDALPGSGYYSKDDFIELLRYAAARHIKIIPEVETPGHARAAIQAMERRYRRLAEQGKLEEAAKYLLRDAGDRSVYRSVQKWNDNVMDVSMPSVYSFIAVVVDELLAMYDEAGVPLETVHLGGDEVPQGVWEKSPAFERLKRADASMHNADDLWDYYFGKVHEILAARNLYMSGWEEVGLRKVSDAQGKKKWIPNDRFKSHNIHLNVWNNLLGNEDLAYRLANAGYKVVLSFVSNFYMDMAYYKKFDEPGFYWGGFIGLEKPYSFIPYNYLKNQQLNYLDRPLSQATLQGAAQLTEEGKRNIVGLQALLWSETVKSPAQMEYLLFPRLLAFAEKAWAQEAVWETEADTGRYKLLFAKSLGNFYQVVGKQELPKLDFVAGGFQYRIPSVGVKVMDGLVHANCELPGFVIRYATNGAAPSADSPAYERPLSNQKGLVFAAFNSLGRSGALTVVDQIKE
ncbi:family 20 glycosylhydrolase [Sphingobacterium griseoflavum]|uniref:beta-N-acetylhexosaminidase n=1 Tax=Sphingobacterium griseoflavum TaxID=1474952 RepID=A0ABQ3HZT4_9SPHI|nr:family 20 glycosylhydrolase [Sphingobacterium griseoflavum]GHE39560.1 beta-N-acetylhexosaminidase [Sphingobacterium griseoflavum]